MARTAGLLLALALIACKPAQPPLDPQADPIARAFFEEVRTGANLDASPHLAREQKTSTTEQQLSEFRDLIPAQPPTSIELKEYNVSSNSAGVTTRLVDLYTYSDRALIVQTALFKAPSGQTPVIIGFKVTSDQGGG